MCGMIVWLSERVVWHCGHIFLALALTLHLPVEFVISLLPTVENQALK